MRFGSEIKIRPEQTIANTILRDGRVSALTENAQFILTCSGTAISVAINAAMPRKALFVATAVEDRPTLASTIYANELE